jgi:di/tricarboxylate transporter
MKWAMIPAVILLVMGILITAMAQDILNFIWPLIVILVGGILLVRAFASGGTKGRIR